jgi:ABC-2 type transport system permease protein
MLWYKAWEESRTRFTIAALALLGLCLLALSPWQIGPLVSSDISARIHHLIYAGTAKGIFAVLSIFIGLGGLLRERARRTATFTLTLPVSRFHLVGTQIGLGLLQLAILSLLPALLIPSLSRLAHQPYPLADALGYSVLWFVCSAVIFSVGYLFSVVLEGEYTAPVLCYIVLMLQALITSWAPLRPYRLNLMWTMAEFPLIPWARLLTLALIALCMFALAAWRTQRQDF